eukprot:m.18696 g.18696  ORF g.18696 m.18696 type:complete len:137 (-) comp7926_c0_seq1:562-972(-)
MGTNTLVAVTLLILTIITSGRATCSSSCQSKYSSDAQQACEYGCSSGCTGCEEIRDFYPADIVDACFEGCNYVPPTATITDTTSTNAATTGATAACVAKAASSIGKIAHRLSFSALSERLPRSLGHTAGLYIKHLR